MSFTITNVGGTFVSNLSGSPVNDPLGSITDAARNAGLGLITKATGYGINPTAFIPYLTDTVSTYQVDVVGIYDSDYMQVVESARPMRASVSEVSRVLEHPVESGGVVSDSRVILPVEISIPVYVAGADYRSTYQAIKSLWLGTQLLTVQTKTDTYPNMLLQGMPHEEDPEQYDMIAIGLRFKEFIIVEAQFQALSASQADATDQSTVSRGEQPTGSVLFELGNKIGLFNK